ncbi:MAG: class I SAM-dependent methyltransferase [Chloroflexota bacterium]|nr:class I SAM-dependent methyltransferase [Chloroflexota bacterium]
MRRFQLIEIEDLAWCPRGVRDAATDYLQFMVEHTDPYAVAGPRLREVLGRMGAQQVVDLCSGAGGPWLGLLSEVVSGTDGGLTVCLTDAYPNRAALDRLRRLSGGQLKGVATPVDATRVPHHLKGFRTLFSSFHHFPPEEARAILADAVHRGEGIAIFEATQRRLLAILAMLMVPLMILLVTPMIRPFRWSRLFWTYMIPVVPLIGLFDGIVSCLRTYTPEELQAMVEGLDTNDYLWKIGEEPIPCSPIRMTYLIGVPPD